MTNAVTSLEALDALTSAKFGLPVVGPDTEILIEGHGLEPVRSGKLRLLYLYPDGAEEPVRKILVRR